MYKDLRHDSDACALDLNYCYFNETSESAITHSQFIRNTGYKIDKIHPLLETLNTCKFIRAQNICTGFLSHFLQLIITTEKI